MILKAVACLVLATIFNAFAACMVHKPWDEFPWWRVFLNFYLVEAILVGFFGIIVLGVWALATVFS